MVASSVDTAVWDAVSKVAGLPLATYLGAGLGPVPAYNSNGLGLMSPEAAADEAEALLQGGCSQRSSFGSVAAISKTIWPPSARFGAGRRIRSD
jgi:hypothetical protein